MARSLRRRVARLGLWFDDDAAMDRIMNSPAMATAFEDATRFADLDRSYPLVVNESVVIE